MTHLSIISGDETWAYEYDTQTKHQCSQWQSPDAQTCRKSQWQCTDGNCINFEQRCNGKIDCPDGSDETANTCSTIHCPRDFGFRCTYGACVNKNAECNGVKDCADNSDETGIKCPGVITGLSQRGNCSSYEFKCRSGECLRLENLCNGSPDCRDASDETAERCVSTFCPSFGFRCAYGACISNFKMCDGKIDCVDGSDEDQDLCDYRTPIPQTTSSTITTTRKPPIIFEDDGDSDGSCRITNILPNSRVVLQESPSVELHEGDLVEQFKYILYKCLDSSDTSIDICYDGKWSKDPLECKKYCSGLLIQHQTITASCEYNLQSIKCGALLNPTTSAVLSCEFGYQKPDAPVQSNIYCLNNGKWNYPVFRCDQVCGTGPERGVEYAHGGKVTNITEVPWHAGLYNDIEVPGKFTQICGGSILSSNMIVSAAHCLWDGSDQGLFAEHHFQVGVGKSRRGIDEKEALEFQVIKVQKFFIHPTYGHATKLYLEDISLILLVDHIIFKPHVKPICLEFDLVDADLIIPPGTDGVVAGWGYTENGAPSEDLKVIDIPYIDYHTCLKGVSDDYKNFIVSDKFCGGYLNLGLSVCKGDSGGGWVYSKEVNGKKRYFLRGIVSNGENLRDNCDPNKYSAFTSVEFYFDWILGYLVKHSPNSIPASRNINVI